MGDAGKYWEVDDAMISVEDYVAILRNFTQPIHHLNFWQRHSLIYYIEQMEGAPRARTDALISTVAPRELFGHDDEDDSVENEGGTTHLYLYAPGTAALGNHTDTTDIVIVQLDGEKEWLLCTPPPPSSPLVPEHNV